MTEPKPKKRRRKKKAADPARDPEVVNRDPVPVNPQLPGVLTREERPDLFWPFTDEERPQKWIQVRPYYPCQRCDRIKDDGGTQAVRCYGVHSGSAYLICHACGHRWTLEVEEAGGPESVRLVGLQIERSRRARAEA